MFLTLLQSVGAPVAPVRGDGLAPRRRRQFEYGAPARAVVAWHVRTTGARFRPAPLIPPPPPRVEQPDLSPVLAMVADWPQPEPAPEPAVYTPLATAAVMRFRFLGEARYYDEVKIARIREDDERLLSLL